MSNTPDGSDTGDDDTLTEANYRPVVPEPVVQPDPDAPEPIYQPYTGAFATAEAARQFRKRARVRKTKEAKDIERVKKYGRKFF